MQEVLNSVLTIGLASITLTVLAVLLGLAPR